MAHRLERVSGPCDDVEQHGVVDPHPGAQWLRLGGDELLVRALAPRHEPLGRLLAYDLAALLRVVAGLGDRLVVLDLVLGCFDHDRADRVEAGAPGAPGDLLELAYVEAPLAYTVELGEPAEHNGADGHVDADAERVRAANDLEKTLLSERLDQAPVAWKHPGMMDTDA